MLTARLGRALGPRSPWSGAAGAEGPGARAGGRGPHLPPAGESGPQTGCRSTSLCPGSPRTPSPGHGQPAERGVRTELTACPHLPSAQVDAPFYEEWWFLLVMALSSLVVLLLVAFALVLHGQNRKYRSCSAGVNPPPPLPATWPRPRSARCPRRPSAGLSAETGAPGPESGRSGAVMVLNLIRKCKHQTGDMSSRLTAPGRRWPGAARMWAWPAGVGPTAVAPPTHLTGCLRPSPHGPPPSSEPPEGRAPLHPQHELQTQHLGLFRGVCCQAGGTTPLVGRSGTGVSGTQGSVTSRWRRLSREGAWGPSGG